MALPQFTFYYLIAVLIQIFLLIFMRKEEFGTRYLYSLTVLIIVQNAIYLGVFFIPHSNTLSIEIFVRLFYAASAVSVACFLNYAIEICVIKPGHFARQIENGVWLVSLCIAILSVFSDELIVGYKPLSFTVTAVRGESFWAHQTNGVMAMITACALLYREWSSLQDMAKRKHCLFIFIAYLSIAVCTLTVTMIMRYGYELSFAITYPFSTTLSLCLIVYGNFKYGWISITRIAPEQLEISEHDQLTNIFTSYTEGKYSFNETSEKIDLLLLIHAYNKHDGNMMKTAEAMGLGRSTLYKKVQKYKLR